ncbi:xylulokinase [Labilibaculum manganireducens]|uniref:Carbohydrate kinase n=1 Tax=Labilibaculum manganireducens TaxID=1940525 RepID=A0A2N3IB73_9BACT|nr:FGGY family carbohydrate kinase [Labilibaculum manganireducens]PKQ67547.1 carbohydrate kinase [Labilibaculum manganireducens]
MYLLGLDIGSSSVKASLLDAESSKCLAADFFPKKEMEITAHEIGWAEQDPEMWWSNLKQAIKSVMQTANVDGEMVKAIGISYQMHGLVCVDKDLKPVRSSIIWCDSRAVEIGEKAFAGIGKDKCLSHLLNSPGNFTASKLAWVKENEPEIFAKIHKIMLPGDFIAMQLTGETCTTVSGLSEGIFWDFKNNSVSEDVLKAYGLSADVLPKIVDTFSNQGQVLPEIAKELGFSSSAVVSYRAGDQPNNALSLNVLKPGEVATTAGTSGVVYGVSDEVKFDPYSRVNSFAHVNHTEENNRLGILLCINGTGIMNSWLNHNVAKGLSYAEMNEKAMEIPVGSDGITILPFGNGAERVLKNREIGAQILNLNLNRHTDAHIYRAAQEGIAFSFYYGMEVMKEIGVQPNVIRAGHANMFLSPLFRETLATVSGATIELYDTDGSLGAARGAGFGAGIYSSLEEAFAGLEKISTIKPDESLREEMLKAYDRWNKELQKNI